MFNHVNSIPFPSHFPWITVIRWTHYKFLACFHVDNPIPKNERMRNSTHPGKVHLELPRLKCSSLYNLCYLCHHLLGPMGTGCRLRDLRRRAVACPVQLPGKRAPQAERGDGCGPVPLETLGDFELTEVEVEVGSCEFSEFLDVSVSEVPFDDLDWFTASRRPRFRGSAENPFFKDFNDLLPASKATSPGSQGSLFSLGSGCFAKKNETSLIMY